MLTPSNPVARPISPQSKEARNSEYFQAYLPFPDLEQSEFECLNLIIVRPSAKALARTGCNGMAKLPVLVYIHGGAGSCSGSDPVYGTQTTTLIDRLHCRAWLGRHHGLHCNFRSKPSRAQVGGNRVTHLAVNLNYRVGVFGGLGSADILKTQDQTDIQGLNFGLYDQKVGLTWAQRNISHFGGDAEQTTLCGSSAGGSCVYAHLLDASSSSENPLFQRAHIQSAPLLTLLPTPLTEAEISWENLCKHWDLKSESRSEQKVGFLRRIPTESMLEASLKVNAFMLPPISDGVTMTLETVSLPPVKPQREVAYRVDRPIEVMIGVTDVEVS